MTVTTVRARRPREIELVLSVPSDTPHDLRAGWAAREYLEHLGVGEHPVDPLDAGPDRGERGRLRRPSPRQRSPALSGAPAHMPELRAGIDPVEPSATALIQRAVMAG